MKYYVFGQDMRVAGARVGLNSLPRKWRKMSGPIPVRLDDPGSAGDIAPESGADTFGDIVSGAYSLYSDRLCEALKEFGIELDYNAVKIYKTGGVESVTGYNMALGAPDADCLIQENGELDFFEIDETKTQGLSFFDLEHKIRIIDETLKIHLEKLELEGVFIIPTQEFGGMLAHTLTWG